jgi:hypothetical protein
MTTLASSLLDFILKLFRDPAAAAAYDEDPVQALTDAGLADVDPTDVAALMPMVAADHASAGYSGGDNCDDDDKGHGHHPKPVKDDDCDDDKGSGHGHHPKPVKDDDCDDEHDGKPHHNDWSGHGHEAAVIHNVRYVENNYSHTDVDVEIDASHSIWAGGDVYAIWGDENVIATGGSVAAGDDVEDVSVDNSVDNSDNSVTEIDVDIEDSFNEDNSTTTTTTITDSNVASNGGEIEDNDTDVDVEVEDSFNGSTLAGGNVDQSTNTDVEVEDSFNGNTLAGGDVDQSTNTETEVDVEVEDSFNETENTLEVEDSFNQETAVEIEDSFNETETELEVEDSFNEVEVEDNTVLAGVDDGAAA